MLSRWLRFARVVQAQVVAGLVVQVMQQLAHVHKGFLVPGLQGQREGGNRLADAKGIQDRVGPTVTSAHQDAVSASATVFGWRSGY